jgi:hypothetical protein
VRDEVARAEERVRDAQLQQTRDEVVVVGPPGEARLDELLGARVDVGQVLFFEPGELLRGAVREVRAGGRRARAR